MFLEESAIENNSTLILWDIESGQLLSKHNIIGNRATLSHDGRKLAIFRTLEKKMSIILMDIETGLQIGTPLEDKASFSAFLSIAFSLDSKLLASVSLDTFDSATSGYETIKVWDAETGRLLRQFSCYIEDVIIPIITFSPNGNKLALSGRGKNENRNIFLFDIKTGRAVGQPFVMPTSDDIVSSIVFSHDGRWFAALTAKSILIWAVETGQLIGTLSTGSNDEVTSMTFLQDGKRLALAKTDKTIRLIDIDPASWQRLACKIANRDLTKQEWLFYFPNEPYRKICVELP